MELLGKIVCYFRNSMLKLLINKKKKKKENTHFFIIATNQF